jgi:serine/threonine-protein kinase
VLIGTVSYVAPELVLHQGTDARTDVYACGVLLYEMLTGRKPHEAEAAIQVAYKHVHEDVPPPSVLRPGLPSYVDALVSRATARDRAQRPPDARVMLRQVRRVSVALEQGLRDDEDLTEDLTLHHRAHETGGDDDWNAFLFESAATDVEHTAVTPVTEHAGPLPTPRRTRRPRRSRRGAVMLVIVLLLAAAAAVAGWQLAVGQYTQTPDLIGLTLEEAIEEAGAEGLEVQVSSRDYSESIPEGDVISTSPAPAGRVLDDGTVEVVVSLGKERYAVPDVTDQTLADAEEALEAASLAVDEPTLRYSGTVDEGLVISASPEPGSMLKPGFAVHLTSAAAPVPIRIPDVRGKTEAVAVERLEDLRFTVTTSEEHSDDVALGEVISQSRARAPASGATRSRS